MHGFLCLDAMTPALRWSLRLGVVAWLLVGVSACTGEVSEEPGQRDVGAQTREPVEEPLGWQETADEQALLAAAESDRALAQEGDAAAQGCIGEAYYLGLGVAQDFEEALRWARLAADQGDARGQGVLAAAHNTGRGVAQDPEEALRWGIRLQGGTGRQWP